MLVAFATSTILKAQNNEPQPYNPCPSTWFLSPQCFDGFRSCEYYSQFPCSPNYCWASGGISNNAGIPTNGIVQNKTIEIGGVYTITQGVTFLNCVFKMHGDSRINLSPLNITNITFQGCTFLGCGEMWQGIFVDASATPHTYFKFWGNTIEDAYNGLNLDEMAPYSIADNTFRNNHIGISNLRQNGSLLNASIIRNTFLQSSDLATKIGSLIGLAMPDYPLAHAGIKLVRASAAVGSGTFPQSNVFNTFICLVNGIVSENGTVASNNNSFQSISQYGIWAIDGTINVGSCQFLSGGYIGIWAEGANLWAQDNSFKGDWIEGIHSMGNTNAEHIEISKNRFTIIHNNWENGIFLSRPQASVGITSIISFNIFAVNSNPTSMHCIYVDDFVDATGETKIVENNITINTSNGGIFGIWLNVGNSARFSVIRNTIFFGTISTNYASWGIAMIKSGNVSLSAEHTIAYNNVSGISANLAVDNAVQCGIHVIGIKNADFCSNTVDNSFWGFHFTGKNDIRLRENYFNHHYEGLFLAGTSPTIGKQEGRGNQWNLDPDACVHFAAKNSNSNPLTSEFTVDQFDEGIALPWLPPNLKLDPDPGSIDWFHTVLDVDPLDHCVLTFSEPNPRALAPYEQSVVLGTSDLGGAALWDLKREVYAALLIYPDLRPASSPEETFFNNLNNTVIASFGQVTQQIRNALNVSTLNQQTFDTYRTAIGDALDSLAVLDNSVDYSSINNLTNTWFAQRAVLLQQVALNAGFESTFEQSRNLQVYAALQNALTYNAGIACSLPYESARKTLNELRIRQLLDQPITQALYQQALALAQQNPIATGYATEEVLPFLAPCDQALYQDSDEDNSERGQEQKDADLANAGKIRAAPNPTNGAIEVNLPSQKGSLIAIYNANGQQIKAISLEPYMIKVSFDLSQNPSGLYWIVFTNEQGKTLDTTIISVSH